MIKIFILGSYVSRDAFEEKFNKQSFIISQYNARTSLARLNYNLINIKAENLNLESNFKKKLLVKINW